MSTKQIKELHVQALLIFLFCTSTMIDICLYKYAMNQNNKSVIKMNESVIFV